MEISGIINIEMYIGNFTRIILDIQMKKKEYTYFGNFGPVG
jgi:hypothetical protein